MARSKFQARVSNFLSTHFGAYTIRENIKPAWLTNENGDRLELDFFIEELKLAIEVQGEQHFKFTEFFHKTKDGFEKIKRHDDIKKYTCGKHGIALAEVCDEADCMKLLDFIPTNEKKFKPTDMGAFSKLANRLYKKNRSVTNLNRRIAKELKGYKRPDLLVKLRRKLAEAIESQSKPQEYRS